jgi:N-acetylglucosaminyl-diphospho-decaprenol L-rhamnosyltransferase
MTPPPAPRTTVVIATRNRRRRLLATLERLDALPERPPVVVVDNASGDGTAAAVRERYPATRVIELDANHGPAARNFGLRAAETPFVALNDDDSWWEPGALAEAERRFDADPRLALVAARILVEPGGRLDPTCEAMADSPLPTAPGQPDPSVLGFVACGAVLRRSAALEVGGFDERMGMGGEESLLSLELAMAGYRQLYADTVVAHHQPASGSRPGRLRNVVRNDLLVAWLRRPVGGALRRTARLARAHGRSREGLLGAVDALREAPWVARERRAVDPPLERALRSID